MEELRPEQQEELRTDLLYLQEELARALDQATDSSQTVDLDQQAYGRVSRIDAIQQQHMAQATKTQSQRLLVAVMQALNRMDSGDYGYCLQCDERIGFLRLKAKPESLFCLKCQSEREQAT